MSRVTGNPEGRPGPGAAAEERRPDARGSQGELRAMPYGLRAGRRAAGCRGEVREGKRTLLRPRDTDGRSRGAAPVAPSPPACSILPEAWQSWKAWLTWTSLWLTSCRQWWTERGCPLPAVLHSPTLLISDQPQARAPSSNSSRSSAPKKPFWTLFDAWLG